MPTKTKRDIYAEVTETILGHLENGTVPWRQPWNSASAPKSLATGKPYRGLNVFLLTLSAQASGFTSPYWATFKQITERGGKLKMREGHEGKGTGQQGTQVTFWKLLEVEQEDGSTKKIPMLRHFYLFNLDQTEGMQKLPADAFPTLTAAPTPEERHAGAQAIVDGYDGPPVREYGGRAFYVPSLDIITVPPKSAFTELDEFYSTLFHEMGHSTGHESRLDRFGKFGTSEAFGTHTYGREELVAEMTSAFLQAYSGIVTAQENSAAYINGWMRTIKEDPRAVVWAAGRAQKAADLILGHSAEKTESDPQEPAQSPAPVSQAA